MNIVIGLTGPTGSGKSSVSRIAEDFGLQVIDCDKTAREATEKGTAGLKALVSAFGEEILLPDGNLNRKALAAAAFKDKQSTELLNKTILPYIAELLKEQARNRDTLLDAPTLFESGINEICHKTVAVLADREIRLKRIIARDNLTLKEAETRINAGKDEDFYREHADYILYNNGDENAFLKRFSDILKEITGGNLQCQKKQNQSN
ncbi:MAG: dephospho-CoA kinase [Acutalibacteraceae bacterium]